MVDRNTPGTDAEPSTTNDQFDRRSVLRGAGSLVVAGGVGVSALAEPAAAGMTVELDVRSTINLEGNGVIPAVVEVVGAVSPTNLPVAEEVSITPRFGPSRLFECQRETVPIDPQQQTDDDLCALKQAADAGDGATPAHGDGHRQGRRSAMLHFRTQEADFVPDDVENGEVDVTLLYAVEDEDGNEEAFVGTDVVKGVAPMN